MKIIAHYISNSTLSKTVLPVPPRLQRLRSVFMMRRYTNPRLPSLYLTCHLCYHCSLFYPLSTLIDHSVTHITVIHHFYVRVLKTDKEMSFIRYTHFSSHLNWQKISKTTYNHIKLVEILEHSRFVRKVGCLTLQEIASPDRPGPPAFAPPPPALVDQSASGDAAPHLAITQPTPSEEDGGGLPTTEDLQGTVLNSSILLYIVLVQKCDLLPD